MSVPNDEVQAIDTMSMIWGLGVVMKQDQLRVHNC